MLSSLLPEIFRKIALPFHFSRKNMFAVRSCFVHFVACLDKKQRLFQFNIPDAHLIMFYSCILTIRGNPPPFPRTVLISFPFVSRFLFVVVVVLQNITKQ